MRAPPSEGADFRGTGPARQGAISGGGGNEGGDRHLEVCMFACNGLRTVLGLLCSTPLFVTRACAPAIHSVATPSLITPTCFCPPQTQAPNSSSGPLDALDSEQAEAAALAAAARFSQAVAELQLVGICRPSKRRKGANMQRCYYPPETLI